MFTISAHNLPYIRSFEACEAFFNRRRKEITSRRERAGWSEHTLPLVNWRDFHKTIIACGEGLTREYRLRLHNTDVIIYYAYGKVEFRMYDSVSTKLFFEKMCPHGWSVQRHRLTQELFFVHGKYGCFHASTTDVFSVGPEGPIDPKPFSYTRKLADMPRRWEIRKKLKNSGFYEWFYALSGAGNSLRAVLPEPEVEGVISRQPFSQALDRFKRAVVRLADGTEGDEFWRNLVGQAFALTWSPYFRSNEACYALSNRDGLMRYIEKTLWEECGGFKTVEITVPPGEKP